MCRTIQGYMLFFAIALAIRANAAPPGCPILPAVGSQPGGDAPGPGFIPQLLGSADAVVVGKMVNDGAGRYGVLVDRVLADKTGRATTSNHFLPVESCNESRGYGLSFLKLNNDGRWKSLTGYSQPLPALPRAPAGMPGGSLKEAIAEELASVFTGTNEEVENPATGLAIDMIGGSVGTGANASDDPSGPSKSLPATPAIRSDLGYANALSTISSIDKPLVGPLLESAYAQARTEKARMWLGLALLHYGDASKAKPALDQLMTASLDTPSLVSMFGANVGTLDVLRAVLPLQRSRNVQIRRALAHVLLAATHGDDAPSESYKKSYLLPALINALEFDTDRGVRDWAMLGVCNISDDCEERYPSKQGDAYREGLRNPVIMASFIAHAKTLIPANAPQ